MDPLLVVSPHLDDAALSVGQVMAGRPDCVVATVFAGVPERKRMLTTYDRDSGFRSAEHAIARRRAEDRLGLALVNARPVHLGFLDHQYDTRRDFGAIREALVATVREYRPQVAIGPLGLAHPDHESTRFAFDLMLKATGLEGWVYEDLPSRVLYPETVPIALDWWRAAGYVPVLDFLGTGDREKKRELVAAYASQLWALDEPTYLVPERVWRLYRCED